MVTINGDTGISAVQDGSIVDADLNLSVKPMFSATTTVGAVCANGGEVIVVFNTKEVDLTNAFNTVTGRFIPQKAGYYQVSASISFPFIANMLSQASVYKNGMAYKVVAISHGSSYSSTSPISCTVYLNGTTDYLEVWAYQVSGATRTTLTDTRTNYFQAHYIGV